MGKHIYYIPCLFKIKNVATGIFEERWIDFFREAQK